MAFELNNGANQSTQSRSGFKKAAAFLNQYLPTESGRTKLGSIPLYDDNQRHVELMNWLKEDAENINKLFTGIAQAEIVFVDTAAANSSLKLG